VPQFELDHAVAREHCSKLTVIPYRIIKAILCKVKEEKDAAEEIIRTMVDEKYDDNKHVHGWAFTPFPHRTTTISRDEADVIFDELRQSKPRVAALFETGPDGKLAGEGNMMVFRDYFLFLKLSTHELYVRSMLLLEAHDLDRVGSTTTRDSASSFEDDHVKEVLKEIKKEINAEDDVFRKTQHSTR
jgi:hypothetical protein